MGTSVFAASVSPLVYQARILKPDGRPLDSAVSLQFVIRSPSGCDLWKETQVVNGASNNGGISVQLGSVGNAIAGGPTFDKVFTNSGTMTGDSCTYSPASTDDRTLYV